MGYEDAARACQAYIDANLDKELTLESIAKALNFSPIYLRRSFRAVSNVTVGKYIQNARLSRAAHDLIHGLCIVSEAAQISGFSSIYSFSKTFSKALGVPPSKYMGAEGRPLDGDRRGEMLSLRRHLPPGCDDPGKHGAPHAAAGDLGDVPGPCRGEHP